MKPLFVDKQDGNTLARALADWLGELESRSSLPDELKRCHRLRESRRAGSAGQGNRTSEERAAPARG